MGDSKTFGIPEAKGLKTSNMVGSIKTIILNWPMISYLNPALFTPIIITDEFHNILF